LEALEKRQAQYQQMDKHSSKLLKEVKTAQENLANFNTVLDKVRGGGPMLLGLLRLLTGAAVRAVLCAACRWGPRPPHTRSAKRSTRSPSATLQQRSAWRMCSERWAFRAFRAFMAFMAFRV
jgi:hypothetical protein